ncbi:unnamed protein product [Prorocentrum cordatum]|uniref:Uncharacterized protein n=1 Tax=Prorocentrum cordatum TaxID=2364126 RepID=A0ABN9WMU7_9DINO|nr:unnamed protein product [Polarella glacialis]
MPFDYGRMFLAIVSLAVLEALVNQEALKQNPNLQEHMQSVTKLIQHVKVQPMAVACETLRYWKAKTAHVKEGAQPRVTAKSAWVTYHADPSPRRRAQLQLAAAQLALQVMEDKDKDKGKDERSSFQGKSQSDSMTRTVKEFKLHDPEKYRVIVMLRFDATYKSYINEWPTVNYDKFNFYSHCQRTRDKTKYDPEDPRVCVNDVMQVMPGKYFDPWQRIVGKGDCFNGHPGPYGRDCGHFCYNQTAEVVGQENIGFVTDWVPEYKVREPSPELELFCRTPCRMGLSSAEEPDAYLRPRACNVSFARAARRGHCEPSAFPASEFLFFLRNWQSIQGFIGLSTVYFIHLVSLVQCSLGITGAIGEIGVAAGKSFAALAFARRGNESLLACDLFKTGIERDNVPEVNLPMFLNLLGYLRIPQRDVQVVRRSSLGLLDVDLALRAGKDGGFRLFHVDGAHYAEATLSDLTIAACALEGLHRYMLAQPPPRGLEPFLYTGRLFLTTPGPHAEAYRRAVREALPGVKSRRLHGAELLTTQEVSVELQDFERMSVPVR